MADTEYLKLHEILKNYSSNVYYQAPPNNFLKYPCIIFKWDNSLMTHADNFSYTNNRSYQVTVIDKEPDSDIALKILAEVPNTSLANTYVSDNLYHQVLTIYC